MRECHWRTSEWQIRLFIRRCRGPLHEYDTSLEVTPLRRFNSANQNSKQADAES